uniref:Uncharacterized protein n=1 Tax=Candidatus Methanophaga sp. ANME-1 ERB7 TaxID=2759913 RepID=A0A7G9ZA05_9EURY|nr:hypothetical protein KECNCEJL_00001 [Methanosarcinales archaeon ANME-1 ERB7]
MKLGGGVDNSSPASDVIAIRLPLAARFQRPNSVPASEFASKIGPSLHIRYPPRSQEPQAPHPHFTIRSTEICVGIPAPLVILHTRSSISSGPHPNTRSNFSPDANSSSNSSVIVPLYPSEPSSVAIFMSQPIRTNSAIYNSSALLLAPSKTTTCASISFALFAANLNGAAPYPPATMHKLSPLILNPRP